MSLVYWCKISKTDEFGTVLILKADNWFFLSGIDFECVLNKSSAEY